MGYEVFIKMLLDNACPSDGPNDAGWSVYFISSHCVSWRVSARNHRGVWQIDSMEIYEEDGE